MLFKILWIENKKLALHALNPVFMSQEKKYKSLKEFYPFYMMEHQNKTSRTLHFIGTFLLLIVLGFALATQSWKLLIAIPFVGYGFAWVGHFFFEKNKPATFQYPMYSLASDFIMFKDILIGQFGKKLKEIQNKS
jgi:hypothetical protein